MLGLHDYLRVLQMRWKIVVGVVVGALTIAAVYLTLQDPTYTATSKAYVSVQNAGSVTELSAGNSYSQQIVASYAALATTPYVLNPVIKQLGISETAATLSQEISVTSPVNTVILDIVVVDKSPVRASRVADAVASQLASSVSSLTPESRSADVRITQIAQADVPRSASAPQLALILGLATLAGIFLGLAFAFLVDGLDTRVRSLRTLEAAVAAPLLGTIVYDRSIREHPLPLSDGTSNGVAEGYRTLRTNLRFTRIDGGSKSFVVTSSFPGEGKSTSAANLAIALSEANFDVLLVDADLRRPTIAEKFGLDGSIGLTDALVGEVSAQAAMQKVIQGKLTVLPAGGTPPNPAELIQSGAMADLMRDLEALFDYVIIDSPPLLAVADAAVLARSAAGAILVCAIGKARTQGITAAADALRRVNAPLLGVLATMVPTNADTTYGYSYSESYSSLN